MLRTVIFLAIVCLSLAGAARAEDPVKMMTNSWPPYVDRELPDQGLAVELVTSIFARAGYTVENTIEDWTRAMEGVRIGLYDVLGAAWRDDMRDQEFVFSEPYLINEIIVVKRRATTGRFYSIGDLRDTRIGLIKDYAYGVDFSEIPGVELVYENHVLQNLMNLLNDKVDFVVGDRRVIALQLDEYLKDRRHEIEVVGISLPPRALYVAGSRATERPANLIREFNSALLEAKRDGSYQKIIEKWRERYPF